MALAYKKGSYFSWLCSSYVLSFLSHLLVLYCKLFWSGTVILILLFNSMHMLREILDRDNLRSTEFAFRKVN